MAGVSASLCSIAEAVVSGAIGRSASWSGGKRRDLGIGSVDDVTLAEARDIAERNQKIARSGGDPFADAAREKPPTFAEMYQVVTENRGKNWKRPGTAASWSRMFKNDVLPAIGGKLVADVTIQDIRDIVEPDWKGRGTKGHLARQNIESVFAWAVGNGYRPDNPAANLKAILSPVRRIRQASFQLAVPRGAGGAG